MNLTRQCYGCKQKFRKDELVQYSSASGKTSQWYCPTCLEEKQARERFSNKVCEIFGIKSPGPIIWTQRKRLRATYGYTDDVIVDCLEYIYQVQNLRKLSETLVLVTPANVEKMRKWKKFKEGQASSLVAAIANTETKEYVVPIAEHKVKKEISLEDGLFDE
jgi:hypothetical protein